MPHRTRRSRKFSAPPKLEGGRRGRGRKERKGEREERGRRGEARARGRRRGPPGAPTARVRPERRGLGRPRGSTDPTCGVAEPTSSRGFRHAGCDPTRRSTVPDERRGAVGPRTGGGGQKTARRVWGWCGPDAIRHGICNGSIRDVCSVCARTAGAGRARNGRRRGGVGAEGRAEALPDEVLVREEPSGFDQVGHGGGTGPTVSRRFTGVGGAYHIKSPRYFSILLQPRVVRPTN